MTEQEQRWFHALTMDRMDSANTLEKPSMRGVQRSVVDKYSDQAHFIYELLQNADDVGATSARFRLQKDGLFFIHNGSSHFTVSDPGREDADKDAGALGHINSITSIANSNKTEASIGKFGVGFKAVFQYTQTPHIYDPRFRFRIERFIVPHLLEADLDWREASETVFWFPFDHTVKAPEESVEDVLEKLKSLDLPTLFLSHLTAVVFEAAAINGSYTKRVREAREIGDMEVQRVALTFELDGSKTIQRLITFTRKGGDGLPYSIGYALGKKGRLAPMDRPAFCFFPTKEATNLHFILHAPFLLTDSREGIKAGDKHNQELIQQLAQLAADSLPVLRDEGLIDDGLLDVIPYDESQFSPLEDRRMISFGPFYGAIKRKLQADALLPAANGTCCSRSHAYWASDTELVELFSDRQLAQLTGTKGACWIFRSRGKKEVQSANRALADFIDGGDARAWMRKESNLIISSLDPETVLKKITAEFTAAQPKTWLHRLYGYLAERSSYQQFVKDKPIFLDQNGNAAPAFDANKQLILFLPDDAIEGYTTVNRSLLAQKATREFIEQFGVKKPSLRDAIYNKILPTYDTEEEINTDAHFKQFFRYYKECRNDQVTEFINLLRDKEFLSYTTAEEDGMFRGKAEDIYLPTPDLQAWFENKRDTRFLALDEYRAMVGEGGCETLDEFLQRLGVARNPRVISRYVSSSALGGQAMTWRGNTHLYEDKVFDGCEQVIAGVDEHKSLLLWRMLVTPIAAQSLRGRHTWSYYGPRCEFFKSTEERRLLTAKWILLHLA